MARSLPPGLRPFFLDQLSAADLAALQAPGGTLSAARVSFASRDRVRLLGLEAMAVVAGAAFDPEDPVVVGDWVLVSQDSDPPVVYRRLDRSSCLRRRKPLGGVQAVAANLDLALICTAMGADLNPRRVERWAALCQEAGVPARVLLTKVDPGADPAGALHALAPLGLSVTPLSALHGEGVETVRGWLQPGDTATLLGSSGVGKSTLINALLGATIQETGDIRAIDEKGRHTTTSRSLHAMPGGAYLVDNPGVREVGLVETGGVAEAFPEIDALLRAAAFGAAATRARWAAPWRRRWRRASWMAALAAWKKLEDEARAEVQRRVEGARTDARLSTQKARGRNARFSEPAKRRP